MILHYSHGTPHNHVQLYNRENNRRMDLVDTGQHLTVTQSSNPSNLKNNYLDHLLELEAFFNKYPEPPWNLNFPAAMMYRTGPWIIKKHFEGTRMQLADNIRVPDLCNIIMAFLW
uniref:Uncharacterized protein n=1 Tax=viral metagenome TaxID=1070528 RepID=A0A6C0BPM5_9ZZZZ